MRPAKTLGSGFGLRYGATFTLMKTELALRGMGHQKS